MNLHKSTWGILIVWAAVLTAGLAVYGLDGEIVGTALFVLLVVAAWEAGLRHFRKPPRP
jgi:4-hydroxybenzoate polyprenyltransferase